MSTTNENKYQGLVNWGNGLSIFFAAVGVLAVIIIVYQLLQKIPAKTKTEKGFKIEYNLQIDNELLKKIKSEETIEYLKLVEQNNKKIAEDFKQQINEQYDRTQKLIELKEDQNLYNTYGAGIIAIILAIGSFFGFKSINQMHKDSIDTAKIEAEKIAEKETKYIMSQKLEEIQKIIRNQVLAELNEKIDSIKDNLSEGATNFYYTSAKSNKSLASKSTDNYNNIQVRKSPPTEKGLFDDKDLES